jgi:mRNA-degrading endonuclease YafQ of YafQ-DinJ toxin-antitoxin module
MTTAAKAGLKDLLEKGVVTKDDVKVLLKWVDEMEEFGPEHIAQSSQWHDHELYREWDGHRSSAFSSAGRVIYKIRESKIIVEVHKVTTDHNYKK